ncbi:hypothetical protein SAMN02745196_01623 [Clostridium collagenovorans DSM 3089]|uniref:Uncharacterized protein n=1 Tax=Clostridium collagenovorans DSM 3089 TaxID=1121306 RepID=A0A1M5W932_9CLOT|nr:hypothetical protein [Clostridium collagenovorans]SHH83975.1 hypothetical protein SAMN02745196_01623 [Clostridium collagenovorans DSM 3089]
MISTSKIELKDLLIKSIQEDESFKRSFVKNPEKAIESKFGSSTLDSILLDISRDTCGLLHVKISDRDYVDDLNEDNNCIHLIMLDRDED